MSISLLRFQPILFICDSWVISTSSKSSTEFRKTKLRYCKDGGENLSESMDKISSAFVLVSNHFAGFAPESANQFRKCAGLRETDWRGIFSKTSQS